MCLLPFTSDAATNSNTRARAASRATATLAGRRNTGTRQSATQTQQQTVTETETIDDETTETIEPEPLIIENKTTQFDDVISSISESSLSSNDDSEFAEMIRKQRAALSASESTNRSNLAQQNALNAGVSTCDTGLRQCMQKICGDDFTKCALDGDTDFGDKLNRCRRETECTGEEFKLFTIEIKADRDLNVQLQSYTSVIECGNKYNACIQNECGANFNKCLGKSAQDRAIKACDTIAKSCTEQDSGLSQRVGYAIGLLRTDAEKDVKADEQQLYSMRDLMRSNCEKFGAMFDERSFDCVYTVNFFAGSNQQFPTSSRKAYAGDSFVCMQEWFGINATTYKENAYRETRSQTGASSAMLGAGLGTAAGLVTSGAIDRAIKTQKAEKALEAECTAKFGYVKDGKCHTAAETIESGVRTGVQNATATANGAMEGSEKLLNNVNNVAKQTDEIVDNVKRPAATIGAAVATGGASLAIPDMDTIKNGLEAAKQSGLQNVIGDGQSALDKALNNSVTVPTLNKPTLPSFNPK